MNPETSNTHAPLTSQAPYDLLRHEAMNNGGTYMATTAPVKVKDLFLMIFTLHIKWHFQEIEVHCSDLIFKRVEHRIGVLGGIFEIMEFKVTLKEVKDLIPYQIFILSKDRTTLPGAVALIDPIDISIYEDQKT